MPKKQRGSGAVAAAPVSYGAEFSPPNDPTPKPTRTPMSTMSPKKVSLSLSKKSQI